MKDQRHSEGSPADRKALIVRYPWISTIISSVLLALIFACANTWVRAKESENSVKWHSEWIQKNNDYVGAIPHVIKQIEDQTREQRKFNEKLDAKLDYLIRDVRGNRVS